MQDFIQFQCQSCGKGLKVKSGLAGRAVKCPSCSLSLKIPSMLSSAIPVQKTTPAPKEEEDLIRPDELLKVKQKRPSSASSASSTPTNTNNDTDVGEPDPFLQKTPPPSSANKMPGKRLETRIGIRVPKKKEEDTFIGKPRPLAQEKEESDSLREETPVYDEDFLEQFPSPKKKDLEDTFLGGFPKKLENKDIPESVDTDIMEEMEETYTGLPKKINLEALKRKEEEKKRQKEASSVKKSSPKLVSPPTEVTLGDSPTTEFLEEEIKKEIEQVRPQPQKHPTNRSIRIAENTSDEIPRPVSHNPLPYFGERLTFFDKCLAYFPLLGVFYGAYLIVSRFYERGRFVLIRSLILTLITLILVLLPLLWYLSALNSVYTCQNNLRALGTGMLQYSIMFGDYEYPMKSGSEFLTVLQTYSLVPNSLYLYCPGTKSYYYATSNERVSPSSCGYLGRKNSQKGFYIPRFSGNESEIVIAADKTHPSDVHGSQINVLFLDNHIETFNAFSEELGGRLNPYGGILESLGE